MRRRMRIWVMVAALGAVSGVPHAEASGFKERLGRGPCGAEASRVLEGWGAEHLWKRFFHPDRTYEMWRSPTRDVGVWVEANVIGRDRLDLRRVSDETTLQTVFEKKSCAPVVRAIRRQFDAAYRSQAFTGRRLAELVRAERRGVIFVWAPNSIHATEGLLNARAAARRAGYPLTVVLHPYADDRKTEKVGRLHGIAVKGLRKLDALDLIFRGALNHHPTLFFFKDGRIHPYIHQGLETRGEYEAIMKEFLQDEKKSRSMSGSPDGVVDARGRGLA